MNVKSANDIAARLINSGFAASALTASVGGECVVACATRGGEVYLLVTESDWNMLSVNLIDRQVDGKWVRATWYPSRGRVLFADSWAKVPDYLSPNMPTVVDIERWVLSTTRKG